MNHLKLIFSTILILTVSFNLYCQNGAHVGLSIPLSRFANPDINEKFASGAKTGFNVGYRFVHPNKRKGIGFIWGVGLIYNNVSEKLKENFETELKDIGAINPKVSYTKYFTFPLELGLNYRYINSKDKGFFVNAGLALYLFKMKNIEVITDTDEVLSEFKFGKGAGFKFGGGYIVSERSSIDIDYYWLASVSSHTTLTSSSMSETFLSISRITMLNLSYSLSF